MNSNETNIKVNGNENLNNIDQLIDKMKKQDSKYRGLYKRMSVLYFVLVFIYAGLMVVNPDTDINWETRLSGICYVISFLIAGYYFRRYYLELDNINYAEPLVTVLKKAISRYKLFSVRLLPMLIVVILIDIGVTISFASRNEFETLSRFQLIMIIQIIYYTNMAIAFLIGYLVWRNKNKPILVESIKMLRELED